MTLDELDEFENFIEYIESGRAGRKSLIKIVLLIYDANENNEPIHPHKIHEIIGGGKKTISDRIKELLHFGFITRRTLEHRWPYTKVVELTERGRQLAEIFDQLRNVDLTPAEND